jgi:hypothetical protein
VVSDITVIDRQHALCGQRFEVASLRSDRGPAFVVIRLPDGRLRNIRRSATDLVPNRKDEDKHHRVIEKLISVRTLLPLVYYVRIAFGNSTDICDGYSRFSTSERDKASGDRCSTCKDQVEHIQPLEQPPAGIAASSGAGVRDVDPPGTIGCTNDEGAA